MKKLIYILILPAAFSTVLGQINSDQAVQAALQNHPLLKESEFRIQAQKYAEKTASALPNPELNAESPTGEFYTIGVLQSFEFPTVYTRRKQAAKAETALAAAEKRLNENELRYAVRTLYLDAQTAEYEARFWNERDSVYAQIAAAAARQFQAGEIDMLQKTLAENEAATIRQTNLAARQSAATLLRQLAIMTGLTDPFRLTSLAPDTADFSNKNLLPVAAADNPAVALERQAAQVADRQIQLAKSEAFPDFSFGYLNQGPRNTPFDYRFRATVGIPLWAGQYRAGIKSAEAESRAAAARIEAKDRAALIDVESARSEAASALDFVRYYEREAIPRSRLMIDLALRLQQAGQTDYVAFLRNLNEAFDIQLEYGVQIRNFEAARIRLLYLTGK